MPKNKKRDKSSTLKQRPLPRNSLQTEGISSSLEEHPTTEPILSLQGDAQGDAEDIETTTKHNIDDSSPLASNRIVSNGINLQISAQTQEPPSLSSRPFDFNQNNNNNQQPEEQKEEGEEQDPQLFTVEDAFRVLTPEEQRQRRLEQERQNLPLVEGQVIPARRPSLTPSQQEAKQTKKENRRLIALFLISAIVLVVVLVPSLLLTNRNNNNTSNFLSTTSPSSNPSTSLIPSSIPSTSIVPSSFPTTSSPTSTTFNDVVALLGLDQDSLSLDPNDYIFRTIQWMANQDQITRSVLLRQKISGTEQQQRDSAVVQRFAMVCLYYATKGDESWFDSLGFLNQFTHECLWQTFGREQILSGGSTINCVNNVVTGIALNDNNLGGVLPTEIGLLTQMTWLEFQRNVIEGTLPSSLSQLSQLNVLVLERNRLSGSIPTELTTLSNLVALRLVFNDLTGPIPESIGDLTNLVLLLLFSNLLTGSIPSSIQSLTLLERLLIDFNMLSSSLPTQINNLQLLKQYTILGNKMLTGTLPFEAGSNPSLEEFDCGLNNLSGEISRLAHLSRLTSLSFDENNFIGTIPTELCRLPLRRIDGAENLLTGSLPDCLRDLTLLTNLVLNNNSLVGSIPTLPTSLEALILWENQLTGRIPTGPFPSMTLLNLHTNNFRTGTIPTELATLANLQILILSDCQLVGTIHTEIGLLTQLTMLSLSANKLFGTIPSEIGQLQNVKELHLSLNDLTGTIPSEMGRLTSLRFLALNANLLTGSLPSAFVNLPVETFGRLVLHNNSLMGDVGFFCRDRSFGMFLADCRELTSCTCCTGCCDVQSAIVNNQCADIFNNL